MERERERHLATLAFGLDGRIELPQQAGRGPRSRNALYRPV